MRHFLLILMIALLPLRGWVSDAMATGMAAAGAQQVATKAMAASLHESVEEANLLLQTEMAQATSAAADCADHALGGELHAPDAHCDSCSACQACHTVALSPEAAAVAAVFDLRTPPRAAVAQFASAEAALGQKPPIS